MGKLFLERVSRITSIRWDQIPFLNSRMLRSTFWIHEKKLESILKFYRRLYSTMRSQVIWDSVFDPWIRFPTLKVL